MVISISFNGLCSHIVNIGIYDYKPNHGCSYIYGFIHSWGTKKGKKEFKEFLDLLFTNNIYMKQI
jgi:hypothetical protein